jgi:hypothetical protein
LARIPLPSRRIHQGGRVWTSESVGYDKTNYWTDRIYSKINWLSRRTIIKLRSIGFQIDEQHPFKSLLNSSKLVAFRTHELTNQRVNWPEVVAFSNWWAASIKEVVLNTRLIGCYGCQWWT